MSARDNLLGTYRPTGGWIERLPVGWVYLLMLLLTVPALLLRQWWLTAACLALTVGLLLSNRLGWRGIWLSWQLLLVLALMGGYQVVTGSPLAGAVLSANLLLAVLASRLLIMTKPVPELLDALVWAARPLRWVKISPELVGLAVTVMLRSIPYLVGVFAEVREAAQARGLERNLLAQLTPGVIRAVGYGQTTGDAIAARGLTDWDE
ncbi:MAG: energy-coupling factor transporter transmembrane component T [Actinomycetia bacterium]|nr:energy-coupling factor transporter transmembrane component T [Actinomycetes bacterium]